MTMTNNLEFSDDDYEEQFSKRRSTATKRISINAKKGTSEYEFVREIDDAPSKSKSGVKTGQVTNIYIKPDGIVNYPNTQSTMSFHVPLLSQIYFLDKYTTKSADLIGMENTRILCLWHSSLWAYPTSTDFHTWSTFMGE
jgi:hypothetical protein